MKNNSEFKHLMSSHFAEIISAYHFNVSVEGVNFPVVFFSNDRCIVRFMMDMGQLVCDFIDPKEKMERERKASDQRLPVGYPVYPSYAVWKFLYPRDLFDYGHNGFDLDGQVLDIKKLLIDRLSNVLYGDFTWVPDFNKENNRLSQKIEFMMTNWEAGNPVREKFRKPRIISDREWTFLSNLIRA